MQRIKKYNFNQIPTHLQDIILSDNSILKSNTPCEFRDRLHPNGVIATDDFIKDLDHQFNNPIDSDKVLGFFISDNHPLYSWLMLNAIGTI